MGSSFSRRSKAEAAFVAAENDNNRRQKQLTDACANSVLIGGSGNVASGTIAPYLRTMRNEHTGKTAAVDPSEKNAATVDPFATWGRPTLVKALAGTTFDASLLDLHLGGRMSNRPMFNALSARSPAVVFAIDARVDEDGANNELVLNYGMYMVNAVLDMATRLMTEGGRGGASAPNSKRKSSEVEKPTPAMIVFVGNESNGKMHPLMSTESLLAKLKEARGNTSEGAAIPAHTRLTVFNRATFAAELQSFLTEVAGILLRDATTDAAVRFAPSPAELEKVAIMNNGSRAAAELAAKDVDAPSIAASAKTLAVLAATTTPLEVLDADGNATGEVLSDSEALLVEEASDVAGATTMMTAAA